MGGMYNIKLSVSTALLRSLQMPLHNLFKNPLAILLDDIPMTRHNLVEVPRSYPPHRLIERRSIVNRRAVPDHPLLPCRAALCVL